MMKELTTNGDDDVVRQHYEKIHKTSEEHIEETPNTNVPVHTSLTSHTIFTYANE